MSLTREQFAGTTLAKSDQINAADLIGGSLVCQITDIRMTGAADQPIAIYVDAHPQPWKPSKTSRRVLLACWPDTDPSDWVGRWIVLFNDESVMWAGKAEGGIRMSHASHIEREVVISVNATRGKKVAQRVEPYHPQQGQAPVEPTYWPDDAFEKQVAKVRPGETDAESVIVALEKKALLSEGQKARLRRAAAPVDPEVEPVTNEPPPMEEGDDPFAE